MPKPRTPAAKARVSGAVAKNPQRHRKRAEPKGQKNLGKSPAWFDTVQSEMWEGFKKELPWLTEADRAVVEIAAVLRGQFRLQPCDFGATKMNLLRLCLAQLGATPADRSKVTVPDGDEEDPSDKFFN